MPINNLILKHSYINLKLIYMISQFLCPDMCNSFTELSSLWSKGSNFHETSLLVLWYVPKFKTDERYYKMALQDP